MDHLFDHVWPRFKALAELGRAVTRILASGWTLVRVGPEASRLFRRRIQDRLKLNSVMCSTWEDDREPIGCCYSAVCVGTGIVKRAPICDGKLQSWLPFWRVSKYWSSPPIPKTISTSRRIETT